jgi:non-specific protein-tyrosine kinase
MIQWEQYLKRLLRWWWLMLVCTALAAVASYYVSLQQPSVYQTTTTLMVGQVIQKANPTGQDFLTLELLAESYALMAVRQPILQATIDSLELRTDWQSLQGRVYAYSIPRTQLLAVAVSDTSPERAVAIADEIGYQLILQSPSSPENLARQERSDFVRSQLDDLESRIQSAQARVKVLQAELDTAVSAREIQDVQTEISSLETLVSNWQTSYADLLDFLQGGESPNYLTVIESAQLPTLPVSPDIKMNVLLAAAVGFVLALGAALLLEYLDNTIKTPEDVSLFLGLTPLGSVSRMKGEEYKGKLVMSHSPYSPIAEAYRLLRTNIQFMAVDREIKSILVTSTHPGEGKSITAANLAVVMAQANLKTIIVDADLRRPVMHKIFQVRNSGGLTDLLRSPELGVDLQLKETGVENLLIVTGGPLPPNSAELLGSRRMAELIHRLEEMADVVIFDSPPVLPVTDAAVLANRVSGVVLVAEAGRTRYDMAKQAARRLDQAHANLLGIVVNRATRRDADYHHYSHYALSSKQDLDEPIQRLERRRWWHRLPVFK